MDTVFLHNLPYLELIKFVRSAADAEAAAQEVDKAIYQARVLPELLTTIDVIYYYMSLKGRGAEMLEKLGLADQMYYPCRVEELRGEGISLIKGYHETAVQDCYPLSTRYILMQPARPSGHISFSPVLPPESSSAMAFCRDVKLLCARYGFDYFGGLHLYPRHLAMINMIYFDCISETEHTNANKLFVKLVHLVRRHEYSEYQAHIDYMDLVADQYDFNGCSPCRLNERIKDTLNLNGILSPGKQGIWPGRSRELMEKEVNGVTNGINGVRL